ncbi:MAG: fibrinogen-like YCDxxxxGGGW domain-containing protein [Minicystis sp.]
MRSSSALILGVCGAALAAVSSGACGFQTHGELMSGASSSASGGGSTSSSQAGSGGAASSGSGSGGTVSASGSGGGSTGSGGTGGAGGGAVTYASCLEWHNAHPNDPNGVYSLTPPIGPAYPAFCEMEAAGGGWTLALKIDGQQDTFLYDQPVWTDMAPFAPDKPDLDMQQAKLPSYLLLSFTALRLGMIDGGTTRWKELPLAGASLHTLLVTGMPVMTSAGKDFWEGLLASGSMQTNCNWEGLSSNNRVRIGIVGDESGDCKSPDSVIGFGGKAGFGPSSGNYAHYSPDHGDRTTKTFGYVLVR